MVLTINRRSEVERQQVVVEERDTSNHEYGEAVDIDNKFLGISTGVKEGSGQDNWKKGGEGTERPGYLERSSAWIWI